MKKIITIISLVFLLTSCNSWKENINLEKNSLEKKEEAFQQSQIYTSFYPIYFLTKEIVWTWSNVINIVPNSWEPHDYEPTLKQIWEMWKSNLIVLSWIWMESYESKLIENIKNVPITMISENLDNLIKINEEEHLEKEEHIEEENNSDSHEHWNIDPHTWLSPKTYSQMASVLFLELEKNWFKNLDKSIIEKLNSLDKKYSENLAKCKRKEFVTSHKAFWYLARDYWLIQTAVLWISPEEEPSANDIANVVELIKSKSIPVIYSEKLVSPKFTNVVAQETWAKVIELNPIETLTPEEEKAWENYISIMEVNLGKLLEWLDCK